MRIANMKSFLSCIFLAITTQSQPTYPSGGLTCDSLEYVLGGVRVQKPTGVCYISGTDGVKLQCNSAGDDIDWRYYSDTGCAGDFYSTASSDDVMELLGIPNTDYSYTCCTGNNCEYVIERTWTATDCTSTGTAVDVINVIGGCTGLFSTGFYQYDSCTGGTVTKKFFLSDSTGSCSGTGDTSCAGCTVTDGDCDSLNQKTEVMCGTANSVCPEPTSMPRQPSIPTTSTPTIPTNVPSDQEDILSPRAPSSALSLKAVYNMVIIGLFVLFVNY